MGIPFYDGYKKNKEAKEVNAQAESIYEDSQDKFEKARTCSYNSLESLGRLKLAILDESVNRFVHTFSQIARLDSAFERNRMDELSQFKIDRQTILEMKELGGMATSMLKGIAGGTAGGALAAFGAYSATATFAAASTGTAIASLSGAAATNATLAFLGGGSLAAGGFGMAGGMVVLGGIVALPALLILSGVMEAKAGENLDNAYRNLAEAKKMLSNANW